jgi:hypothetical protein
MQLSSATTAQLTSFAHRLVARTLAIKQLVLFTLQKRTVKLFSLVTSASKTTVAETAVDLNSLTRMKKPGKCRAFF